MFRTAITREVPEVNARLHALVDALRRRYAKKLAAQRCDTAAALAAWQQLPSEGRLVCAAHHYRKRLLIEELRLYGSHQTAAAWGTENREPGVVCDVLTLSVSSKEFAFNGRMLFAVSLHALARRIARAKPNDHDALRSDLLAVADHVLHRTAGGEDDVRYLTESGTWLGEWLTCEDHEQRPVCIPNLRTFLPHEMIDD